MTDASGQWFDHQIPDLSPAQRAALEQSLRAEGIPATFGATAVRTDVAYQARVATLIDQARAQGYGAASPPPYPGTGAPAYPGQQYPAPGYAAPPTNSNATTSLIIGIASLVLGFGCGIGFLGGPVAIILGQRARREIAQTGEQGDGMALAGVITGAIASVILALGLIALIVVVIVAATSGSS